MMMEDQEAIGSQELAQIIKGKRTKRQRPASPLTLAITTSSSSAGESGGDRERISNYTSPSTSLELTESNGEEEDMANCLILLAQGHQNSKLTEPAVIATRPTSKAASGLYVYQCKTCNRCFPSFQALGGHRASHKKPKANNYNEEKKGFPVVEDEDDQLNNMSTTLSLQIANRSLCSTNIKSNKVHDCLICGAEFPSGQALGGHMRRHRTSTATTPTTTATRTMSLGASSPESQESKKPRNSLQLDLNLPAPEDDVRESKLHFASKGQVLVFSASPLVDCHY